MEVGFFGFFQLSEDFQSCIKGTVHPKVKMLSLPTHPMHFCSHQNFLKLPLNIN